MTAFLDSLPYLKPYYQSFRRHQQVEENLPAHNSSYPLIRKCKTLWDIQVLKEQSAQNTWI